LPTATKVPKVFSSLVKGAKSFDLSSFAWALVSAGNLDNKKISSVADFSLNFKEILPSCCRELGQ